MLGADGAGIKAGFFDDLDALAATAAEYDGRAKGIYVTLNPVNPELLMRHNHPGAPPLRTRWPDSCNEQNSGRTERT